MTMNHASGTDSYRLSLCDDAIAECEKDGDTARVAILVAYRQQIVDGQAGRPVRDAGESTETKSFGTAGNGSSARPSRRASDAQMRFITDLRTTRLLPADNLHSAALALHATGSMPASAASDLITWLKSLPAKPGNGPAASDKQKGFIAKLRQERGLPVVDLSGLSKDDASQDIEELLAMPVAKQATAPAPSQIEAGMYRMDDVIYKVQLAVHGSGKPYAKRLVQDEESSEWFFEYAAGMVRRLQVEHRMSLDEAKAFGALYGTCCVCGRTLTDEKSIENGIGPVCGKKYF